MTELVAVPGRPAWAWVGVALCVVWAVDLLLDWVIVRQTQRHDPEWSPWAPGRTTTRS